MQRGKHIKHGISPGNVLSERILWSTMYAQGPKITQADHWRHRWHFQHPYLNVKRIEVSYFNPRLFSCSCRATTPCPTEEVAGDGRLGFGGKWFHVACLLAFKVISVRLYPHELCDVHGGELKLKTRQLYVFDPWSTSISDWSPCCGSTVYIRLGLRGAGAWAPEHYHAHACAWQIDPYRGRWCI